jgi:hypothetical protein
VAGLEGEATGPEGEAEGLKQKLHQIRSRSNLVNYIKKSKVFALLFC